MSTLIETHCNIEKEWLLTNGIGGYASTALNGAVTRKYHGWLVASLPPPLGRTNMCTYLQDSIKFHDGTERYISSIELLENIAREELVCKKIELHDGLPTWTYIFDNYVIEKSAIFINKQNTIIITYNFLKGTDPIELIFRPFFHFKHHESPVNIPFIDAHCKVIEGGCEITSSSLPPLHLLSKAKWSMEGKFLKNVIYRIEAERGYDSLGDLEAFGYFSEKLEVGGSLNFILSTEPIDLIKALSLEEAKAAEKERRNNLMLSAQQANPDLVNDSLFLELVNAADQFIVISPRNSDTVWTNASGGGEAHTIIAGYPWFTDWGRDSMISLEGLALVTGRHQVAKEILHLFSHHVKDGLIPNMFPDGENEGVYYTADASLWFIHAVKKYYDYTQDSVFLELIFPKIDEIIQAHINGTKFGIHMDSKDGLLKQGADGYALTWMDAKVGDLVVTPRRGKAVEINALWYNALMITIELMQKYHSGKKVDKLKEIAEFCKQSFNQKFWFSEGGYLYDIVEGEGGNDSALRPNQLFAFSLDYPVLEEKNWKQVLDIVHEKLVTPYGLRTLSSKHPNYKVNYAGSLLLRDLAYHQGTIWAWLIGPYIDCWLKVYPDKVNEVEEFLKHFARHLNEGCLGSINEIFDSSSPHMHRGCHAQAWSVSEVLRAKSKLARYTKK